MILFTRRFQHPAFMGFILVCALFLSSSSAQAKPSKGLRKGTLSPSVSVRSAMTEFAGKRIAKIQVKGLKRIEKDAVLAKLVSKPGEALRSDTIREDLQKIYAMGFFDDVEFQAEVIEAGVVDVTIVVRERPVISKIEFDGNERISSSDLKDVIKLKEWAIFDVNKVREDTALIQKHYEEKGFYLAKVSFAVKQAKNGEVELTYKVNDYEKVQIKKITFLNNRSFTEEQLKGVFQETREGGLFSFMSGSGNFKESSFKQDLQRLTYWYLDHGFIKFRYENPVVTVSDDKRWLFISIYVDEGQPYTMGSIDFGGDLLFSKEELQGDLSLTGSQIFSISKRNADIQKLSEKYQDLGYAFVNVIPKMNMHDDTRVVDMQYDFEKGNLVYFGEINIVGNSKTHDKVIRRELKIHEGELYSGTKLRISRENVERLGYFAPGEVLFNTTTPRGKQDVLNVEISVKERSTGTITLGAGYGSVQKFFFTTQISEINLFGRGQVISLSAQYAADAKNQSFRLGFTDPYSFDTRWSLGFDLYDEIFSLPAKYTTRKLGFDVRAGYPLGEYVNAYLTYKNEGLQITEPDSSIDPAEIAADHGILSSVVASVIRDKRNNRYETSDGSYQSGSIEFAGLGGDKKFIKLNANNRFYKKVWGDLVFKNSTEVGHVYGYGDRPLAPSEKFYLGGPNNMKGYNFYQLGPLRILPGKIQSLGGVFEFFSLFEFEHPLVREAGLKWVTFFDVGNAWDPFPSDGLTLRTDVGLGLRWFSPIGPLRFEWGFPLGRKPYETTPVFVFFIGPPF